MPETKRPLKVFLCHASQDKPVVRELAQRLFAEGWIDPWLDEKKLLPGQDWRLKIEEAVEASDIVIFCLSSNSVTKEGFIQKELRYAREIAFEKPEGTIFLIPLRLDESETPRGLRFYQWADYFGEMKEETYNVVLESLKIRYEQKLSIERELARQSEKEREEHQVAEKAMREKVEQEAVVEEAKRELDERARREKLKIEEQESEKPIKEGPFGDYFKRKKRVLEAAIEKRVQVEKPASLFVWIRREGTKNIIHFIPQIDENVHVDEDNVKTRDIKLEFPTKNGRVYPVGISIRLVAPDFTLVQDQKNIIVPPDNDSIICTFTVIPMKAGDLLLTIEIYKDGVLLSNRSLYTEAVMSAPLIAREILIVRVPVEDVFKPRKVDIAIIVALIGLAGTLIAGLLGSPLIESWFSPAAIPTVTQTATITLTFQPTPATGTPEPGQTPTEIFARTFTPVIFNDPHPDPSDHIDSFGVPMRLVPAGEFAMGSEGGDTDERPVHTVDLDTYYIDKYEVTNAFYKACVDAGVCQSPQNTSSFTLYDLYGNPDYDNYPVMFMSWNMAKTYCEWRGAQLPTEAQWEKAARGTDGRTYPWGEEIDQTFAHYDQSAGIPAAVGSYERGKSPYGVYDMAGNVWEWVGDWYSQTFYANSPTSNPSGPGSGQTRVLRGGTWYYGKERVRTFSRDSYNPIEVLDSFGFRCAKDANP